jgi:murein DD-endopeptidase MepM/ murein hydrolase activator NlpD
MKAKFASLALALLSCSQAAILPASALEIELHPAQARQGDTVQVILQGDSGSAPKNKNSAKSSAADTATVDGSDSTDGVPAPVLHFRNKTYKAFPFPAHSPVEAGQDAGNERKWRVLLSVPADLPPGKYMVKSGAEEVPLKVVDAGFGVQILHLPNSKNNFNGSTGETQTVDAAKATVSPRQYWDGKFLRPSKARTSSPFGLRRRVNGVLLKDYFHSGLDFAGAAGSPVLATQTGKVIIAHQGWKLHGNTICIDHGQGVLSFYIHLSRIFVKEGDIVKAGEKIGAIGSTGRANGPHLHFSIYVNNEATNPSDWFNNEY